MNNTLKSAMLILGLTTTAALLWWSKEPSILHGVVGTESEPINETAMGSPGVVVTDGLRRSSSASTELTSAMFVSGPLIHARTIRSNRLFSLNFIERYDPYPEHEESFTRSSSFDISIVAPRVPNDWFIFGITDGGKNVLVRWSYTAPQGSIVAQRPLADVPMGTPYPAIATLVGPRGGVYVHPDNRDSPTPERRLVISRDLGVEEITAAEADPDGRFVLFATGGTRLIYQREVNANGSQVAIFSQQQIPTLGDSRVTEIYAKQHGQLGRVFCLEYSSSSSMTLLLDADNDGIFEDHVTIDRNSYDETMHGAVPVENFDVYE